MLLVEVLLGLVDNKFEVVGDDRGSVNVCVRRGDNSLVNRGAVFAGSLLFDLRKGGDSTIVSRGVDGIKGSECEGEDTKVDTVGGMFDFVVIPVSS